MIRATAYVDGRGNVVQALRVGWVGQTSVLGVDATATSVTVTSDVARIVATIPTHIVWGGTATAAATTDMLMPGNVVEYQVCDGRKTFSCIAATATTGNLYVTEIR